MSDTIWSVVIASLTTLITIWIKDVILHKRSKMEDEKSIYQRYSKPLQKSLEKLIWRLIEILETPNLELNYKVEASEYYNYKYLSTLYRFMTVLAWLRVAGRELTYYKVSKEKNIENLNRKIHDFKSSIADGTVTEIKRVQNILDSQGIAHSKFRIDIIERVGNEIDNYLLTKYAKDYESIQDKNSLVHDILRIIEKQMGVSLDHDIDNEIVDITLLKECWLYRDWQDAIGDFMLVEGCNKDTSMIMSYRNFENLYLDDKKDVWIVRSEKLFKGFCISNNPKHDYRIDQMKNILFRAYDLLLALDNIKMNGSILKDSTKKTIAEKLSYIQIIS